MTKLSIKVVDETLQDVYKFLTNVTENQIPEVKYKDDMGIVKLAGEYYSIYNSNDGLDLMVNKTMIPNLEKILWADFEYSK